ncbi:MAG: class I tRNA ligase family protein, partial [archaeon]
KMSKSKGNIVNPWDAFGAQGVDAVRLQFMVSAPGAEKRFGIDSVNEVVKPFLVILWNSYSFAKPLIESAPQKEPELKTEDKWLISRINSTIAAVEAGMEKYDFHKCTAQLVEFVNEDLSRTYIKLVRNRAKENDSVVAWTFNYVFKRIAKCLAPLTPYIAEEIHSGMGGGKESVHLEEWPRAERIESGLEEGMNVARKAVQAINSVREKQGIGIRQPLRSAFVLSKETATRTALKEFAETIRILTNVKEISACDGERGLPSAESEIGKAFLSVEMDPELEAEGIAREITRKIQALRKKAGLNAEDRIISGVSAGKEIIEILKKSEGEVMRKTGSERMEYNPEKSLGFKAEESIKGERVIVMIEKIRGGN